MQKLLIERIPIIFIIVLGLLAGCSMGKSIKQETPRWKDPKPQAEILQAVHEFKKNDPDATFTYFNGHVDSFATTAKPTVPDYAKSVLRDLGLPTDSRLPLKLMDPVHAGKKEKPSHDLEGDFTHALPILPETEVLEPTITKGEQDIPDFPSEKLPKVASPQYPPENPQKLIGWDRLSSKVYAMEQQAILPILEGFVSQYQNLFQVSPREMQSTLRLTDYQAGAYFRKAVFEQHYASDEPLLYGRTLVHFDINWNVIGISRMIITPHKLPLPSLTTPGIDQQKAVQLAKKAFPKCPEVNATIKQVNRAVDPIRRVRVWDIELLTLDGDCHWRTILEASTGRILNVSDLVDRAFTDAKVNRWYFPQGNLFDPHQIVSPNIYTRNDRRLEHDFFFVMNDHRCEGDPESACAQTTQNTLWCEDAHGTTNGDSFIRATRRTSRDFDQYYPSGLSEAFAETHTYYWARSFSQWLKPSLDAMGVLPNSASNYPRVLIITNACRSGSVHNSSYQVTTDDNKGEGTNVIRLAHRFGSSDHNKACEGGGCVDNPSNIHHELNHFILKRYYGVGSDLDCGGANQLKFTHEGILGTAVPHAYWHNYYGVGFNPSSTDKLYFSHTNIGRVHTTNSNRMSLNNFLCVDSTDDPYRAGRVVGQALWEFYHGKHVQNSTIANTWRPTTDTDFNIIVYWAADLQAGSTYKDRYEFANRVMEILDKYSNWSRAGKQDYCDIFAHHQLDNFISPEYCN